MYRRYNPLLPLVQCALIGGLPLAGAQAQTVPTDAVHLKQVSQGNAWLSRQPLPGVYSAGQPEADDWAAIAKAGVGTVIDLTLVQCALIGGLPLAGAQAQTVPTDAVHLKQVSQGNAWLSRQPLPGVYSAGQPEADDWAAIAKAGVGTVIDLRPDSERPQRDESREVRDAGMRYVQIPVAGPQDLGPQTSAQLWNALQTAREDGGQVLVHCASANRAGGLLALALAQHGGRSNEQALQLGRDAGMTSTETRVRALLGGKPDAQPQK